MRRGRRGLLGVARRSCSCGGGGYVLRGSVDLLAKKGEEGYEETRLGMGKRRGAEAIYRRGGGVKGVGNRRV